jgi:uncharacterized protein YoxC
MTVTDVSLLVIAICQVVWLVGFIVAALQLRKVAKKVDPIVEQVRGTAENVKTMSHHVEQMVENVKRVEERITGVASRVVDQVEPPVKTFAALLAGVRAGINRLVHASNGHQPYATISNEMRREYSHGVPGE